MSEEQPREEQRKLRILFVNIANSYAFSQKMCFAFKRLGHTTHLIESLQTIVDYLNSKKNPISINFFSAMGNPFSIKELIKFKGYKEEDLDLIFIEQGMFYFEKNAYCPPLGWTTLTPLTVPVVYYHRDLWNEVFMRFSDLLLYRFANHRTALQYVSRQVWSNTIFKLQFRNAVDLRDWDPNREKEYKGLNFIGTRIPLERYLARDYVQRDYYKDTYDIVEYCREHKIAQVHDYYKMKFPEYHAILERCEALLFIPGKNAYLSRRLYEAAACKCMLFMYVPSEFAKLQYERVLGLTHGLNCVMFENKEQLKNLWIMYKNKRKKIVENAYEWVSKSHTYDLRALELEKVFYQLLKKLEEKNARKEVV